LPYTTFDYSSDRFDKFKIPKGDPDAKLGIMVNFNNSSKKD